MSTKDYLTTDELSVRIKSNNCTNRERWRKVGTLGTPSIRLTPAITKEGC